MVIGTTGWLDEMDRVRAVVEQHRTGLVWSPNFSIGVNVFFRVVREAARLLESEPQYGAWAWEIHHHTKKDAPSGTLLKLVEEMKAAGYSRPIDTSSNRAGAHPGTHEIGFDSAADTITLRHAARSREGFARGALKAAQWLPGKQGVFKFEEVLFSALEQEEVNMFTGCGTALVTPFRTDQFARRSRPCGGWSGGRSRPASIFWCPAAPRARARR